MENRVTVVGRPNVGKSSLFNALIGKRRSLVHPQGGTTRDRIEVRCPLPQGSCLLVDTGGILPREKEAIPRQVLFQVGRAAERSELLLFVVDVQTGLLPLDLEIASLLRKFSKPILLIANKADNPALVESAVDFYPLGMGDPIPVSSVHRRGIEELKTRLLGFLRQGIEETPPPSIRIAVVGRPNVGKSSFINTLLHDDRLLVDAAPGTTRDPVDVPFMKGMKAFLLVDTAGVRRFSKIRDEILFQSVKTTRTMIQKSDVCLLLLDGALGLRNEDLHLVRWILEEGRGVVLLVNKWDLVKDVSEEEATVTLRKRLGNLAIMPILFISARTGKNVLKAIDVAEEVAARHAGRIETSRLNALLEAIRKNPSLFPGRRIPPVTYAVQVKSGPPRFLLFGSLRALRDSAFTHILERKLREKFPLEGTPIQFDFREKKSMKGDGRKR